MPEIIDERWECYYYRDTARPCPTDYLLLTSVAPYGPLKWAEISCRRTRSLQCWEAQIHGFCPDITSRESRCYDSKLRIDIWTDMLNEHMKT